MNVPVKSGQAVALAFAQVLTGEDNPSVRLASIVDEKSRTEPVGEVEGTILDLWPRILEAQRDGRGIFIFPNKIASVEGYCNASNVLEHRAHFADFDKGFPAQWHREPDLIVKTSIKDGVVRGQAYWLIVPCDAVTWRRNQRRLLLHYGDDTSVSDPARRLRLPGLMHLKDPCHPHLVTFGQSGDPDARLLGLPTSDEIVADLPELPTRVVGSTANDDWSWSKHRPETVRKVYAHIDCVMKDNYGGWIGRIKLLAERGIEMTEPVPDEWWFDTAMEYCRGDLRRQHFDKNFPTPDTFKEDKTENEVRAMFEGTGQENGGGKYTVHSLYLDAFDAGYRGPFDEQPLSEIFKGFKPSPNSHTVIPIPTKYRRAARFLGYQPRKRMEGKADDLDWHRALTTKRELFTGDEITELLTTHRYDKRRNASEREYAARFAFTAAGLRRGHTPQELYDTMVAHGNDRHMAGIKDADDPGHALRIEIENVSRTLGDDLDKAVVRIIDGQEAQTVDKIEEAILSQAVPIFESDSVVVTPGEFSFKAHSRDVTTMRLIEINAASFANIVNRAIELQRFSKTEKAWLPVNCPDNIAKNFMQRHGGHILHPVAGITLVPVLREDGSILNEAGYDSSTGLIYEPCGVEFPEAKANPTKADAKLALDFLMDPLRLVPFATPAAKSVAASGFLSLLARRVIGNVPVHGIDATAPGSGKTLLVDCASVLATGDVAQPVILAPNDEENTKTLAALLRQGSQLVSYDNVTYPLGFAALESVVVSERPQARILGMTKTFTATNNSVIYANGNSFSVQGDMHRRTLVCRIDAQDEHPERRQFEFNPLDLYRDNRPAYVLAALTILRAYIVADKPDRPPRLGSFEGWSDLIRGALMWLGYADPVETQATIMEDNSDLVQLGYLLEQLEVAGLRSITSQNITKAITSAEAGPTQRDLADAISNIAGSKDNKLDMKALGKFLERHKGRIVNGRRIEPDGYTCGARRWKLFVRRTA